jgi:hypothetical protein
MMMRGSHFVKICDDDGTEIRTSCINSFHIIYYSYRHLYNIIKMTEKALSLGGLGIGLMQWGTTGIDNHVVNPKGNLPDKEVRNIWRICREHKIVFFDTAEGK